jgi:hypothetical protein
MGFNPENFYPEGFFPENFFPDEASSEFTPATVLVEALRRGFFDDFPRSEGDRFYIESPHEYSPYWMSFVESPPSDWTPLLEVFSDEASRNIVRPVSPAEARAWVLTGALPPEELS